MSRHSFDPEVAAEVGLNAAVIYQNICWWIEKNAVNDKHEHDGFYWTYNSVKAFDRQFPYLTSDQIRRALEKLEAAGLIRSGNFNETAYDRTKWFCAPRQMDLAKLPNGSGENAEPIPDGKPDHKPDSEGDLFGSLRLVPGTPSKPKRDPKADFEEWWTLYPKNERKASKAKCREVFDRTVAGKRKDVSDPIDGPGLITALKAYVSQNPDPKYVPAPLVWLNQTRWEAFTGDDVPEDPVVARYRKIAERNSGAQR